MKSRSESDNLVMLCRFVHHRAKTDAGKTWRPVLIGYLNRVEGHRLPESIW